MTAAGAYAAPGDLDKNFAGDGVQTSDFSGEYDAIRGVAVQPDGKIVVAGRSDNTEPNFALARYKSDGSLDPSFSGDGKQTTDFGGWDEAYAMTLQPDGKIVVVGDSDLGRGIDSDLAVARYNADGSLDTTFSTDGKVTTDLGGGTATAVDDDLASAVTVQPDGKLVVAGTRNINEGADVQDIDWALARYNTDGSLDDTFSGDGLETTDFGGDDGAAAVALQHDGKIVVSGSAAGDFGEARYNNDGSLDTSFSGDGKHVTDFGGDDFANTIAIQSDGKILTAGGSKAGAPSKFALARFLSNGTLDTTFSGDGKQTTDFAGDIDVVTGIGVDSTGRIVAAGGLSDTLDGEQPPYDLAVARYTADGSLDATFSGDGLQTTDLGGFETAYGGVAIQTDDKIVVAGTSDGSGGQNADFLLARYLGVGPATAPDTDGDGILDPTDQCPTQAAATPNGCPAPPPDSDGDRLADGSDACPTIAAPTANGCPATPPLDLTPPAGKLTGPRSQKLRRAVSVRILCPEEPCRVTVSARIRVPKHGVAKAKTYRLKSVERSIGKATNAKIALKLPTAATRAIRRALKARKRVAVELRVTIADHAGNQTTQTRRVRLRR